MKRAFVRSRRATHHFKVSASASLLVAMATSFSPSVLAQSQPGAVTLVCSAPSSTANTADLTTAAGTWSVDTGSGLLAANSASNVGWSTAAPAGNKWIGDGGGGNTGDVSYSLSVVANDPNIVLASAKISYSYLVDDYLNFISWNGSMLPSSGSTSYNTTPYTLSAPISVQLTTGSNTLLFSTHNNGGPYGLDASVTLTYNCAPPVLTTAPANAPWALWLLSGLVLAGVTTVARRRRGHTAG